MQFLTVQELEIEIKSFFFFQSDYRKADYNYAEVKRNDRMERIWEYYTLCLFTEGLAHLIIGGKEYRFPPNSICFYRPGLINIMRPDSDYSCYTVYLSVRKKDTGEPLEFSDRYICFLNEIPVFHQPDNFSELYRASMGYRRCMADDSQEAYLRRQLYTRQLVLELFHLYRPEQAHSLYHPIVAKAISYFDQNMDLAVSMKEVADAVGVSEKYFQRVFKNSTGITPNEYLTQKRLSIAVKKLLTTKMSIADIAFESGFSGTNYFSYVFKKHYQCTPTQFRLLKK